MGKPRLGAVTNAVNTSASPSVSHYWAPGQVNAVCFVKVTWTGTATISAITANGQAMSSVGAAVGDGTGTSKRSVQWYYILGSSLGTVSGDAFSVNVTFSASNKWHLSIHSLDGVDQATPFGTQASDVHSGTDTGVSCAPSSAVDDIVLVGFGSGTGTPTIDAGQTRLEQLIATDTWGATSWKDGTAGTTTVGYTYASSSAAAIVVAFAVKGQSGGPPALVAPSGNANRSFNVNSGPENPMPVGTLWKVPFGSSSEEASGTGLSTSAKFAYAATLGKASIYVSANTCTQDTPVTVYVADAATAIVITVPASTTGAFSDTAHSASVAAGDKISWAVNPGNGGGTGSITVVAYAVEVIPTDTTKTVTFLQAYSAGDTSAISYPTNELSYHTINGSRTVTNASEALAQVRSPIDGTLTDCYAELYTITAGSRHLQNVTLGPRINGANGNGTWAQAPVTADGFTTFDAGTDSIVVGDKLAWVIDMDPAETAAKQFGLETLAGHFVSSEKYFFLCSGKANGAGAITAGTTRYLNVSGEQTLFTTEAPATATVPFQARLFRFWAHVVTNTTTGGTAGAANNIECYVRKNGARVLRLSFPRASGDDQYQMDLWNTIDVQAGDTISFETASTASANSYRIVSIGMAVASIVNFKAASALNRCQVIGAGLR